MIGILGLINSFKSTKCLIESYYVSNILATIVCVFISIFIIVYTLMMKIPDYYYYFSIGRQLYRQFHDEYLNFFVFYIILNICIKIPGSIISSIYSKTLINDLACPPPTQDIEMNSFAANEDETEQFINKSD